MNEVLKITESKTMEETIKICYEIVKNQDNYKDNIVTDARELINNYLNY